MAYQRVWAEVNLDSIAHNIVTIRKHVNPAAKIMAVVKADGYGHGAVEVSKILLYNGADCLGVAICDEGVTLREHHILVPILILGYTPEPQLDEVVNHNLTQTVFSKEMAEDLSARAISLHRRATVHIKIDTGMSRLGFLPTTQAIDEILYICGLPGLYVEGIYTHFATSDSTDKSFTYEQAKKFHWMCEKLEEAGAKIPIRHTANSGAILGCDDLHESVVRAGILLYGLCPSPEVGIGGLDLKPAMSLKSRLSLVKRIDKGVSVGYSRTFYTQRESVVATVPVGYADGYARNMNRGGRVLVSGQSAPIIGNICMDQFMIDVTDIENVHTGDEIVLMGGQGHQFITADEVANIQDTINYEVVCAVGKRVPRVYIKNNATLKMIKV